jgi:hypothetical protein
MHEERVAKGVCREAVERDTITPGTFEADLMLKIDEGFVE